MWIVLFSHFVENSREKKENTFWCVTRSFFFFLLLTPTPPPLNLPSWVESGCSWSRTHPQWTPPPLSYRKNVVSPIVSYWVYFGFLHGPLNFGFDNFISYQIVELPDESWNSVETRRRPSPLFLRALVWKLKIIKNNKRKKKPSFFRYESQNKQEIVIGCYWIVQVLCPLDLRIAKVSSLHLLWLLTHQDFLFFFSNCVFLRVQRVHVALLVHRLACWLNSWSTGIIFKNERNNRIFRASWCSSASSLFSFYLCIFVLFFSKKKWFQKSCTRHQQFETIYLGRQENKEQQETSASSLPEGGE